VPAVNGVPWWFLPGQRTEPSEALDSVDPGWVIGSAIPREAILSAVAYAACSRPEPGVSRYDSGSQRVFGELDASPGDAESGRLAGWVALLRQAGLAARATDSIRSDVWRSSPAMPHSTR
jgi:2-dehydropantoate 2-reductase